jgi:polyribonucleotide nucleotidyltransferase
MDIKIEGMTRDLSSALRQARDRRILRKMLDVVDRPKADISEFSPAWRSGPRPHRVS